MTSIADKHSILPRPARLEGAMRPLSGKGRSVDEIKADRGAIASARMRDDLSAELLERAEEIRGTPPLGDPGS
jgi:hypothetical protein